MSGLSNVLFLLEFMFFNQQFRETSKTLDLAEFMTSNLINFTNTHANYRLCLLSSIKHKNIYYRTNYTSLINTLTY